MKEVLKFSASWCGPCKTMSNVIKSVGDIGVVITEIDIDEKIELSAKYGIRSVPTMILLEDGHETKRVTGVMTSQQLKDFVEYE
jgi:thioredoxin 1